MEIFGGIQLNRSLRYESSTANVDIHKTDYKAGLLHDSFNQSWGNIRNSLPTFVRRLHFRGDIQGIEAQYTFDDGVFFMSERIFLVYPTMSSI